jgi:uncharacterized damage-inducible protein DinB
MTDLEYYRQRFLLEAGVTGSVLEQMQQSQSEYRPHPKAPTAGELLWTIVRGLQIRLDILRTNEADAPPKDPYPSHEKMLSSYRQLSEQVELELATTDQGRWEGRAEFRSNGKLALDWPVRDILWMFHFDVIHHRGQLTTYLRPMGGRVPSIYGRSGDDIQ